MPKRKADVDEASEGFGSSDREESPGSEPPSSKARTSKKSAAKKGKSTSKISKTEVHETTSKSTGPSNDTKLQICTNAEGDKYIDLGKKRRAVVRSFKGMALLDIREYYGPEGDEKPGKKGISLQIEQWQNLKDAMFTIDELFGNLKK